MKTLPKACDICRDKIGLYQAFYTVQSEGRFLRGKPKSEMVVLCPRCFQSYKDFLNSREEYFIYQKAKAI